MSSSSESPWQTAAHSKLALMMKEKEEEFECGEEAKALIRSRQRRVNQAPKVKVPNCQVLCERVLIKSISLHSVVPLLDFARKFSASTLEEACVKFITASYRTVSNMHAGEQLRDALGADTFDWLEAETREMEVGMKRLKVRGKVKERSLPPGLTTESRNDGSTSASQTHRVDLHTTMPGIGAQDGSGGGGQNAQARERPNECMRGKALEECDRQQRPQVQGEEGEKQTLSELPASGRPLKVYPYEWLLRGVRWPPDVDPSQREAHLSEKDFVRLFGVSWQSFAGWPVWRQRLQKQRVLLF